MIDLRLVENTQIYKDLSGEDAKYWFDFKRQKFLHNIDTFYYSIKFKNDFTNDSKDINVKHFRSFFEAHKKSLRDTFDGCKSLYFANMKKYLNLKSFVYAGYYPICLECPDWFDLFMATSVPHGKDGGESVTCEWLVQIRSYMLWMYGVHGAFQKSFEYIKGLAEYFRLEIDFVQENRVDYCWHSNYLSNPEYFFREENFYKMRVDRYTDANTHSEKVGSSGYEVDYIAMGKRSDKVFVRIYLKSKEVVEKGYKPWFLKVWLFNGLINRYDFYVYEKCFLEGSWRYLDMARIRFYSEYGTDEFLKKQCIDILDKKETHSPDILKKFADRITPKVNLIINVEYQTMRKHSKSYDLLPLKDNSGKGECKRVYDYLDNRKLIADYLTHNVFRLVEPEGEENKSRRDYVGFWKALRRCKMVDVLIPPDELELTRIYNRKMNAQILKERMIKASVTYGIYTRGVNMANPLQDMIEALCVLNDNDIEDAIRFKSKKLRQFNADELAETVKLDVQHEYKVINAHTGEVMSYSNTDCETFQVQDLDIEDNPL